MASSLFSHVSVLSVQSRNWEQTQRQRLLSQRQSQEQHRQEEARRVDRERRQQASLRDEESFENRKYLRQVQQELKEREMESALLKVGFTAVPVMLDR